MFACLECGKRFRTTKAAERAASRGCPKCGGVDIDLYVSPKTYYLADPSGTPLPGNRTWQTEDGAHDYVVETFGEDAWNNTAILCSY